MDIYCPRCDEPYDTDEVYHGMTPIERHDLLNGIGCSTDCKTSTPSKSARAIAAGAMYELLGDDLDGAASMLDDLDYLGMLA